MANDLVIAQYTAVPFELIEDILRHGGKGELVQKHGWKQAISDLEIAGRTNGRLPVLIRAKEVPGKVEWWADVDGITHRRTAGTVVTVSGLHALPSAIPLTRLWRVNGHTTLGTGAVRGNEPCLVSRRALGRAPARASAAEPLISDKPDLRPAAAADVDADPSTQGKRATTRERLIDARLGQGMYRTRLMRLWGKKCALTGCAVARLLVASHAKKWSLSTNEERLDRYNGLLLSASADKLFDAGLIAFDLKGKLLISPLVSSADLATQGLRPGMQLRLVKEKHLPYLEAHRKTHGF